MVPSIEQEIHDLHALFGSPRDPEGRAFVPLADAYRRSGDPSRALELLGEGLERHPQLAAGHLVEGLSRRDLADDAGAEAAFRRALDLDGDNARALVALGRLVQARGDVAEGEELVGRGLALDPLLSRVAAPDRVPRHTGNPEVVGATEPDGGPEVVDVAGDPSGDEELAPLEWEVLDAGADSESPIDQGPGPVDPPDGPLPSADLATPPEAAVDDPVPSAVVEEAEPSEPSMAEGDEAVIDVADLSPEAGSATEAAEGLRDDDPRDFLVSSDAEAALLDAVSGSDEAQEGAVGAWPGGDLDIDWNVNGGDGAGAEEEPAPERVRPDPGTGPEPDDELVMDAADLAPDDWSPDDGPSDDAGFEAPSIAAPSDDLLIELADLAPDIEPGSRRAAAEDDDEVLPTRTLGELYARQGLLGQAVKVFEDLVARSPADPDLRSRLDELRAARGSADAPPVEASSAPEADPSPPPEPSAAGADEGPPVSEFLTGLLSWTRDRADEGAEA